MGGVDVFAGVFVFYELSTGEGDDVSVVVVDGEHEAVSEADPEAGFGVVFISLACESCLAEFAAFVAFVSGPVEEECGVVWHPADHPAFCHFCVEAAVFEVFAGVCCLGGFAQHLVHEVCGFVVELDEA